MIVEGEEEQQSVPFLLENMASLSHQIFQISADCAAAAAAGGVGKYEDAFA